jgi:hypothetical protein
MARFYFHFANGQTTLDEVGIDLPDVNAARKEALGATRDLMFEAPSHLWAGQACRIWVTDKPNAAGQTILSLELTAK